VRVSSSRNTGFNLSANGLAVHWLEAFFSIALIGWRSACCFARGKSL
jgi:hypothetical protein